MPRSVLDYEIEQWLFAVTGRDSSGFVGAMFDIHSKNRMFAKTGSRQTQRKS